MLKRLQIQNFILIDSLDVSFDQGLSVITGETGAGKSILIDALTVLLGARASKSFIRTGQDKTQLKAWFSLNVSTLHYLQATYPDQNYTTELIIEKEVLQSGKSMAKINGQPISLQVLKEIGDVLVDIHGQHEHQALMNNAKHVDMLDAYGEEIAPLLETLQQKVMAFKAADEKINALKIDDEEANRQIELLKYQVHDIESVQLKADDDDLEKEFELLKDSETLLHTLTAVDALLNGNEDQTSLIHQLLQEHKVLKRFEALSPDLKELSTQLNDLIYQSDDLSHQLRHYKDRIQMDDERLYALEKRLDRINLLKRKYGASVEAILEFKQLSEDRLDELENIGSLRERYLKEKETIYQDYLKIAAELTNRRHQVAERFEREISLELKSLNMDKATFVVEFSDLADQEGLYRVSKRGIEAVEFLVSFNPGEMVRPLKQVASGGEMSRVMLALKVILARQDLISTLIFDEVDTGISGKTASIVAEKLYKVSLHHQVLCISHLSQLALMADWHYLISKESDDNTTKTNLERLTLERREEELARMLGGAHQTQSTKEHVKELLENIQKHKALARGDSNE
jgi:DNA repair protein RecN (Recombination protein N)